MGEEKRAEEKMEEKKPEEANTPAGDEEKKSKKKGEEKKDKKVEETIKDEKEKKSESPPPPQEIVLKVYMHCEGCARKVHRTLKGFEGVEDVVTDCKTHKVIVKGEKADPLRVLDRVQRKSHRQVELISPIPKPSPPEEKKPQDKEKPKTEEKKAEPEIFIVVLKVHMHCEACAQEIQKRIQRMKGVESAEADPKSSQVTVKGTLEPSKLVEQVYKRTGKKAEIVKKEPEKKEKEKEKKEAKESKEEKKAKGGEKEEKKAEEEKKETKDGGAGGGDGESKAEEASVSVIEEDTKMVELRKSEYNYNPQRYAMEMYAYPPQIFSDENPNACSVM